MAWFINYVGDISQQNSTNNWFIPRLKLLLSEGFPPVTDGHCLRQVLQLYYQPEPVTATFVLTLVVLDVFKLAENIFAFISMAFQAGGVLSLPASAVRPSVCTLYLVRAIIRHRFYLGSLNVAQTCVLGYSRSVLKMEFIDLNLQAYFGHLKSEFLGNSTCPRDRCYCIRTTLTNFARNMHPVISTSGVKMGVFDFDFQCHLAISTQNSRKRHSTSLLYTDLGRSRDVEGIVTSFLVMAVTPQTPKCHHNRGATEVGVTFGSL